MPIAAELRRKLYNTRAWADARARVLARAERRCECTGGCGKAHGGVRCPERHLARGTGDGLTHRARVILTVAHLDHNSGELVTDDRLAALCQGCHLRYDQEQHLASRTTNQMRTAELAGQGRLL